MFSRFKRLLTKKRSVQIQKQIDINLFKIPENFLDPIDYKPFIDPVMTPFGHLYSRHIITTYLQGNQTDPFTRQPLTLDMLDVPPADIRQLITNHHYLRSNILDAKIHSEELLLKYQTESDKLNQEMEILRERYVNQGVIRAIKNNLKIDIHNPEHLAVWRGKCRKEIPAHIDRLMQIADEEYKTAEDFTKAINKARQRECCSRFFNFISCNAREYFLSDSSKNVRTLVIR